MENIIEMKGAKKQYGSGEAAVFALDGVDFSLAEEKICVILGPSGSGKSTLLNMIGGLDTPDAGEITVDGVSITHLGKKALTAYRKRKIGFVFQFYNLIPDLTVEENVQVVAEIAEKPLDTDEILRALDIEKYRYRFPRELSGGQQQRVAIARAMVKKSPASALRRADRRARYQILPLRALLHREDQQGVRHHHADHHAQRSDRGNG